MILGRHARLHGHVRYEGIGSRLRDSRAEGVDRVDEEYERCRSCSLRYYGIIVGFHRQTTSHFSGLVSRTTDVPSNH